MRSAMVFAILTALSGCDPNGAGTCSSDDYWTGGNEESPLMNPGGNCIGCHADEGEGPTYTAAGTVMGDVRDQDDCNGVSGITVRITDADDNVIELQTNAAGNFFTSEAIAFPYNAEIERDGVVVGQMVTAQSDGNCASCHTEAGLNAAPGRIYAP